MRDLNIAILGAGAAGYGTYMAFKDLKGVNCSVYNFPEEASISNEPKVSLAKRYSILKKKYGYKLFSIKTNRFLRTPKRIENNLGETIWDSMTSFGLISFWGGVSQKLNRQEFITNIGREPDEVIYDPVDELIYDEGDCRQHKDKNTSQVNMIKMHSLCEKFFEHLIKVPGKNFSLEPPKLFLKRANNFDVNCGNLLGCAHVDTFFSSKDFFLKEIKKKSSNLEIISEKILDLDIEKREVATNESKKVFDFVFVCLGPYQTQKLLNKALKTNYPIIVKEPTLFTFPIFYTGKINRSDSFFGLTNFIFNLSTKGETEISIQVYPPNKHIFLSTIPSIFWGKLSFLKSMFFSRFLYLRVYCGMQNQVTKVFYDKAVKQEKNNQNINHTKNRVYKLFKRICKGTAFIPLSLFFNAKTSSHYAGCNPSFLLHVDYLERNKIFITDSSNWKSSPAKSPTITIIANATHRAKKIIQHDIS